MSKISSSSDVYARFMRQFDVVRVAMASVEWPRTDTPLTRVHTDLMLCEVRRLKAALSSLETQLTLCEQR